ncbi:MAG: DNA mismatch repair protein MutS [Alphaproteobacteria bacterium]|nr:DNA mismatch repair protein MutS [Alphaproteobacteria bacterium]
MSTPPAFRQASFLPELSDDEKTTQKATPLLAQYFDIKKEHKDCLLFFRLGDFYEMFFDDAAKASKALDIALTRRGRYQGKDVPMCGVPAHAYESYVAKLIRAGFRVAICEQKESPEEAKKRGGKAIVTRDVVRIMTPGTVTEDSLLDARQTNYLACLTLVGETLAFSWCDLVGGTLFSQEVNPSDLPGLLAQVEPSEILVPQRLVENEDVAVLLEPWAERVAPQPNSRFDSANAERRLLALYGVSDVGAFGDFSRAETAAMGALLDYVDLTQKTDLKHFARPIKAAARQVAIDASTRRNLELTRTLSGEKKGSLLASIDRTQTGAGARLLASRLTAPLTDVAAINARLGTVAFFVAQEPERNGIQGLLRQTPDLERALARLALGRGGPRDLAAAREALRQAEAIRSVLINASGVPEALSQEIDGLGEHSALIDVLERALVPDLPLLARDGNFIARGFSAQLDEIVTLRDDGKRLIAGLQQKYAAKTGIGSLKIKHNQIIGYHIDVSTTNADKLFSDPDTFIHRQTLASSVRFTTVELSELARRITEAADRALAVELTLFDTLVQDTLAHLDALRKTARALAIIDVNAALAALACERHYVRPTVDQSMAFCIKGGRHPVVEQALAKNGQNAAFIANDCDLAPDHRLWLLTGPNMAGKSTFLRQNALIALLAQMGSFVPASEAHIGVVDRLFSRVGAADDLAAGRSTFMVEMIETAAILNQATARSFVILDEIGRGTATYDGLSIAWAVLEYLQKTNGCRALFATHYHELTALKGRLPTLYCATMKTKEWENEIVFLHEVIEGVADRSYGIHVARMAGLPEAALARAAQVLAALESKRDEEGKTGAGVADSLPSYDETARQAAARMILAPELEAILRALDPDALNPRQAQDILYKIKSLL